MPISYPSRRSRCVEQGDQWHLWLCVCVCSHSKRRMTWAINTWYTYPLWEDLGMYWPSGQKVKGQGHKVMKCAASVGMHVDMTARVSNRQCDGRCTWLNKESSWRLWPLSVTIDVVKCTNRLPLWIKLTSPQSNLRRARRKGPIGFNGTPQIHPKTAPSFSTITIKIYYTHTKPDSTHHPNGIRIPISHFCHNTLTGHTHTHTHTHTHRWSRRQVRNMSDPLATAMLIESDALKYGV